MVTQLLFGDLYHVTSVSQDGKWVKINTVYDDYEGWIDAKVHNKLSSAEFEELKQRLDTGFLVNSPFGYLESDGEQWPISIGSILPDNKEFIIGRRNFLVQVDTIRPDKDQVFPVTFEQLKSLTSPYLNVPYLWGGKSILGIDCSGFVQQVFKFLNVKLPRDAYQQAEQGKVIHFNEHRTGDLAFFANTDGKITHVGIVWVRNAIIHASGRVRIDKLNEIGIFNSETGFNTHFLHSIRRIS
ncbi:MAG: C40 family peptidase [Cytophagales bacterium]|nr:C40 family peptidase [Cytophagales bacterium]